MNDRSGGFPPSRSGSDCDLAAVRPNDYSSHLLRAPSRTAIRRLSALFDVLDGAVLWISSRDHQSEQTIG